jgi:hypothetical protein
MSKLESNVFCLGAPAPLEPAMITSALDVAARAFGMPAWDTMSARLSLRIKRQVIAGGTVLVLTATRHSDSELARAVRTALNLLPEGLANMPAFTATAPEGFRSLGPGGRLDLKIVLQRYGYDRHPLPRWSWAAQLETGELVLADKVFGDPVEMLGLDARPFDGRNNN